MHSHKIVHCAIWRVAYPYSMSAVGSRLSSKCTTYYIISVQEFTS